MNPLKERHCHYTAAFCPNDCEFMRDIFLIIKFILIYFSGECLESVSQMTLFLPTSSESADKTDCLAKQ